MASKIRYYKKSGVVKIQCSKHDLRDILHKFGVSFLSKGVFTVEIVKEGLQK